MRIIAFTNKGSGVGYHRIMAPLLLMQDIDVFITNNLNESDFEKGCDVLMYNRILPDSAMPAIAGLKKKYGFKVVVDVDDYWHLDSHHILYRDYILNDFANTQIWQIKIADVVLVTHERLAAEVKPYNSNVHIVPNAIPKQGQFDIERTASPFTRLFWQGSSTHRKDIELLKNATARISYDFQVLQKVKMIIAGFEDNCAEWKSMVHNYTNNLQLQYKIIPAQPIYDYYSAYQHADICLIPLLESAFNRHKSNLKVLEAANLGLPVICSNVHPYKDLPVLYVNKPADWYRHIKTLARSKKAQKEAGQRLKEYCDKHYDFNKINELRKQILTA